MERRKFLAVMAATVFGAPAGAAELDSYVTAVMSLATVGVVVDDLERTGAELVERMWRDGPVPLVEQLRGYVHMVQRVTSKWVLAEPYVLRLRRASAEAALALGRLEWQLRQPHKAMVDWEAGERLARLAGAQDLVALGLGLQMWPTSAIHAPKRMQNHERTLEMLDRALQAAPLRAHELRAWLLSNLAKEHAAAGKARAADEVADEAARWLGRGNGRPTGYLAPWSRARELAVYQGGTFALLGRPEGADMLLSVLEEGMELPTQRCVTLLELAMAYAERDPEQAGAWAGEALELARERTLAEQLLRGVRTHERIKEAHPGHPVLARLREQITSFPRPAA